MSLAEQPNKALRGKARGRGWLNLKETDYEPVKPGGLRKPNIPTTNDYVPTPQYNPLSLQQQSNPVSPQQQSNPVSPLSTQISSTMIPPLNMIDTSVPPPGVLPMSREEISQQSKQPQGSIMQSVHTTIASGLNMPSSQPQASYHVSSLTSNSQMAGQEPNSTVPASPKPQAPPMRQISTESIQSPTSPVPRAILGQGAHRKLSSEASVNPPSYFSQPGVSSNAAESSVSSPVPSDSVSSITPFQVNSLTSNQSTSQSEMSEPSTSTTAADLSTSTTPADLSRTDELQPAGLPVQTVSSLNVNAAVFVPKAKETSVEKVYSQVEDLNKHLDSISDNPALFTELKTPMTSLIQSASAEALNQAIDLLVYRGSYEMNLQYTIASFCTHCCQQVEVEYDGKSFLIIFLNRLGNEHSSVLKPECEQERLIHFAFFLAEIYLQLKTAGGSRSNVIRGGVMGIIRELSSRKSMSAVKSAIKLFKLCGAALDEDELEEHGSKENITKLMTLLSRLLADSELPVDLNFQIKNLTLLRANQWGCSDNSSAASAQDIPTMDPVYFNNGSMQVWAETEYDFGEEEVELEDLLDEEKKIDAMFEPEPEVSEDGSVILPGTQVKVNALQAFTNMGVRIVDLHDEDDGVLDDFEKFLAETGQAL